MITEHDSDILNWLERNHTLHRKVEALYVVDGYSVEVTHDANVVAGPYHGETLREAYSKAIQHWDNGERLPLVERVS